MPFGLMNVPATFQKTMNVIFAHVLHKGVIFFIDGILIYSPTMDEHNTTLKQVFQILQHFKFYIKASKCSFAQQKLEYLCHIISAQGVATDPTKIQRIKD